MKSCYLYSPFLDTRKTKRQEPFVTDGPPRRILLATAMATEDVNHFCRQRFAYSCLVTNLRFRLARTLRCPTISSCQDFTLMRHSSDGDTLPIMLNICGRGRGNVGAQAGILGIVIWIVNLAEFSNPVMDTPLVVGVSVAAAALGGRYLIGAWQALKARPSVPRVRRFYEGGFERIMTRREAALVLGVREHAVMEKIKEAHRRVMVANHPDSGGSHYLASKINEAKDIMIGRTKGSGSAF
ncbi:hypothetical protein HHK36_014701 [Tetracentron sinense]|uniref:J domain-containing protein n=1 Tax=Tetracentron sinense TaxID=13715 RepID=A0A835DC58_TETSI|nr:hypothetical protein HHK36_014701 [Tetracentron sinense]